MVHVLAPLAALTLDDVAADSRRALFPVRDSCLTSEVGRLGAWNVIAVRATNVCLAHVKSPRPPAPADREALALFPCSCNCERGVHVWDDRPRLPEVLVL